MAKKRTELSSLKTISVSPPNTPGVPVEKFRHKSDAPVVREIEKPSTITAKTDFGKKLLAIRNKAIKNGLKLLTNDEILTEVARGRNELS